MSTVPEPPKSRCPACFEYSVITHCPKFNCGWGQCTNLKCDLMIGLKTGKGHYLNPDPAGKVRLPRVRFPAA